MLKVKFFFLIQRTENCMYFSVQNGFNPLTLSTSRYITKQTAQFYVSHYWFFHEMIGHSSIFDRPFGWLAFFPYLQGVLTALSLYPVNRTEIYYRRTNGVWKCRHTIPYLMDNSSCWTTHSCTRRPKCHSL